MRIITLDLSMKGTGWAGFDGRIPERTILESGVESFAVDKHSDPAKTYHLFTQWLTRMLDLYNPQFLYYEKPVCHGQGNSVEVLMGIKTRVDEACYVRGIARAGIYPITLKKQATGNAHATKEEMVATANELFDHYHPEEDTPEGDEADALLLLWLAQNKPEVFEAKPRKVTPRAKRRVRSVGDSK